MQYKLKYYDNSLKRSLGISSYEETVNGYRYYAIMVAEQRMSSMNFYSYDIIEL